MALMTPRSRCWSRLQQLRSPGAERGSREPPSPRGSRPGRPGPPPPSGARRVQSSAAEARPPPAVCRAAVVPCTNRTGAVPRCTGCCAYRRDGLPDAPARVSWRRWTGQVEAPEARGASRRPRRSGSYAVCHLHPAVFPGVARVSRTAARGALPAEMRPARRRRAWGMPALSPCRAGARGTEPGRSKLGTAVSGAVALCGVRGPGLRDLVSRSSIVRVRGLACRIAAGDYEPCRQRDQCPPDRSSELRTSFRDAERWSRALHMQVVGARQHDLGPRSRWPLPT